MPNAGRFETRRVVAEILTKWYEVNIEPQVFYCIFFFILSVNLSI
jgi:hypothetical protein